MYHIERIITEINKPFEDATHTIYENSEYRGSDVLVLLMQDFFCIEPAKMHNERRDEGRMEELTLQLH